MKYGLIGEKLGHSFSPDIHKRLATSDYTLKEIPREALGEFLTKKEFNFVYVNSEDLSSKLRTSKSK